MLGTYLVIQMKFTLIDNVHLIPVIMYKDYASAVNKTKVQWTFYFKYNEKAAVGYEHLTTKV